MNQHKLSTLALALATLLAWGPDAVAQRGGASRGSPSGSPSTPSRGSVPQGIGSPSRGSAVSPSRSSPSPSPSRTVTPSSPSGSRSLPSWGSASPSRSSSSRTITVPDTVAPGTLGAPSSGSSRSESSPSSNARTYGLPPSRGSTDSADSARTSGFSGSSRGSAGSGSIWTAPGVPSPALGGPSSARGSSDLGSNASSSRSSGERGSDIIYAAPRRVPFPSPASPAVGENGRSSSRPGPTSLGLGSDSGPSASRFGLDRGQSTRGGPSSARTLIDRTQAERGSSRVGGSSAREAPEREAPGSARWQEPSDRTRASLPGPSGDRNAILDRYREPKGTSGGGERDERVLGRPGGSSGGRDLPRESVGRGLVDRGGVGGLRPVPPSSGKEHLGKPSPSARGQVGGIEHTQPLRDLAARDPRLAREVGRIGRAVGHGTRAALHTGLSVSLGVFGHRGWGIGAGYWDNGLSLGFWSGYGNSCYSSYGYWWALGGYPYSYYSHPFSYPYYCFYGYWPRVRYWYPSYYYPVYYSYPAYTASVITRYVYDDPGDTYVYVNTGNESAEYVEQPAQVPYGEPARGEGVAAAPTTSAGAATPAIGPDSTSRATGQYLTLGDQAFRDGRFADAVHFYARAVQFSPEDGVVWLVLSDGLFATGDYHYGAFALRKALELDPTLAQSPVDKRGFYTDAAEFDRQLALLEVFVLDHPGDQDARLVLAANYLFGGRPAAAVDLLEEPGAEALRAEAAGAALLEAARAIQYG